MRQGVPKPLALTCHGIGNVFGVAGVDVIALLRDPQMQFLHRFEVLVFRKLGLRLMEDAIVNNGDRSVDKSVEAHPLFLTGFDQVSETEGNPARTAGP